MYQGYVYVKVKVLVSGAFTPVIEPISASRLQVTDDAVIKEWHEHTHAPDV